MRENPSPYSAGKYEAGIRRTLPFYDAFYSETVSLVGAVRPDVSVWLDTGCGTGAMVARAFPAFPKARFLLADPSAGMLEQAEKQLKDLPGEQLRVIGPVGSESLPETIRDKPQVVTAILAHHYFDKPQRETATKRCYDLLERGGVYITFENTAPATKAGKAVALARWRAFQTAQGKTEAEAAAHIGRCDTAYFPITVSEHLALLGRAGFRTAELFWLSNMQAGFYGIK